MASTNSRLLPEGQTKTLDFFPLKAAIKTFVNLYPVWIISGSVLAYSYPLLFSWFSGNWMVGALALVMLGMGLTLHANDFKAILKIPSPVFIRSYT